MDITTISLYEWNGHQINDGINFHSNIPLDAPPMGSASPQSAKAADNWPIYAGKTLAGRTLPIQFEIRAGNIADWMGWFDTSDPDEHQLVVINNDDGNLWYVYATVQDFPQFQFNHGKVILKVCDPIWKSFTPRHEIWHVVTSPDTNAPIVVDGNYDALPVFTITPLTAKGSGFTFRRWCAVLNQTDYELPNYGIELTGGWDVHTLISNGYMKSSGDDLRVYVNGLEVTRWFDAFAPPYTAIKVWIALNLAPRIALTLGVDIAGSGAVSRIYFAATTANDLALARLPSAGILLVGTEAFSYDGKDAANRCVVVTARELRDTTIDAHTAGVDAINWVQYDVLINYGYSTIGAPIPDDTHKPAFSLASTNAQWIYTEFGDFAGLRPGSWQRACLRNIWGNGYFYDGTHKIVGTDPRTAMGMGVHLAPSTTSVKGDSTWLEWSLYNPCGISLISSDGDGAGIGADVTLFRLQTLTSAPNAQWVTQWLLGLTLDSNWHTWSKPTETPPANTTKIRFYSEVGVPYGTGLWIAWEVDNVTVDIANPPTVLFVGEAANYALDCIIENTTTGESMAIYSSMQLASSSIIVDTKQRIIYLTGNVPAMVGRELNTIRRDWLPLAPGPNVLKFTDAGTDTVDIEIDFEERNL
jgi:hypothetical protein